VKVKIHIPESMSEITLGQYQRWLSIEGDDDFRMKKLLEIVCGVSMADLERMRYVDVHDAAQATAMIFTQRPGLKRKTELSGNVFGFVPSLDDISLGEYTDLEDTLADWQQMHRAMAVLYRPVTSTFRELYDIEPYQGSAKYADTMKNMPLDVAMGCLNFMYRLGIELSRDTLKSLAKEMETTSFQEKARSLNGGDGITSTTPSHLEMLRALRRLAVLMSTSPLHTPPTKNKRQPSKLNN
jgi:hypothetical protein